MSFLKNQKKTKSVTCFINDSIQTAELDRKWGISDRYWPPLHRAYIIFQHYTTGAPRQNWHHLLEGGPFVVQASPARLVF